MEVLHNDYIFLPKLRKRILTYHLKTLMIQYVYKQEKMSFFILRNIFGEPISKDTENINFKKDTKFARLIAPNEYEKISFDDFVISSCSCVGLATYLFNLVSYDYIKIINEIPQSQIARWKKYKPERCEKDMFAP